MNAGNFLPGIYQHVSSDASVKAFSPGVQEMMALAGGQQLRSELGCIVVALHVCHRGVQCTCTATQSWTTYSRTYITYWKILCNVQRGDSWHAQLLCMYYANSILYTINLFLFSLGCPAAVVWSIARNEDQCVAPSAAGNQATWYQLPFRGPPGLSNRAPRFPARSQLSPKVGPQLQTCSSKSK